MIKLITTLLIIVFIAFNTVQAQENKPRIELSADKYTFMVGKDQLGDQYIYLDNDIDKKADLPKGNYFLKESESVFFWFSIDDNGQLCDSTTIRNTRKNSHVTVYYKNGKTVGSRTHRINDGTLYSTININDSIQDATTYYPSGNIQRKNTTYLKKDNAILSIKYNEDGTIKSENNELDQTYKIWYPNGNLERIHDIRNSIITFYNEDGTVDSQSNPSGWIRYYYKNGKLNEYRVTDNKTGINKTYNANGKLIEETTPKNAPNRLP